MNFLFKNKYVKIIEYFLAHPLDEFYVNELLNVLEISPQVLCESLKELEDVGVLTSIKKANSIYYRINNRNDLISILKKVINKIYSH